MQTLDEFSHSSPNRAGSGISVLVVDDESAVRRFAVRVLQRDGYEVLEAADGHEALEMIRAGQVTVDLIVSDIRLPGLNALDVLRGARGALEATPVILITAFGDQRTRDRALLLGASAVFDKPLDVDDLIDAAYRLLTVPRGTA